MHRPTVPGTGHWTRLNLFDGWQVLGTIGLVLGMLAFTVLIAHSRLVLPSTGNAIQLLQTFVSDTPRPEPTVQPAPAPNAAPSPSPVIALVQPAEAPHVWRPPVRSAATSPRPVPTSSATPAPTPVPIPVVTPTPRPCDQKVCPTPSPTPTPSGP